MKRSPLKRLAPLRRGKRLNPVSRKRAAIADERRELVQRLLLRYPSCQVCGREPSTDVHEKLTRARGGSILDESNCVAVGRWCHRKIHDQPKWAESVGLLIPSWRKP